MIFDQFIHELKISDNSWPNSMQEGAGQVWKGANILHLLLKEQQRTGTEKLGGGEGQHDLPQ